MSTRSDSSRPNSEHTAIEPDATIQQRADHDQEKSLSTDEGVLIEWSENDPENPRNWTNGYKYFVTAQLSMMALAGSIGAALPASTTATVAQEFGLSIEVTVLQVALYILGFAFGPLIWAPVSEVWGRRWSLLPALFFSGIFAIGAGASKNAATLFITRFISGVFGSATVSNVTAALGDIWEPSARGIAMTFYSITVVGGPALGPVISAAILINPHMGWRWTSYIQAIWQIATAIATIIALPEMYSPILLSKRARKLRKETGDSRYYHPHESAALDVRHVVTKHFSRPMKMLITEPVVTAVALYASFVYGILFMTLEAFPIVFQQIRMMSPVPASLPFLGLFVGVLFGIPFNLSNQPRYKRLSKAAGGKPVPDARLPPIIVTGVFFATGLFWFGWTSSLRYSIWNQIVAAAFIGVGFNVIFNQCMNVLVDTYGLYAASATSANTFLRSLLAFALPMVVRPMFQNLGVGPAMSILGGIATAMVFVPFLLLRFGPTLRKHSRMAAVRE